MGREEEKMVNVNDSFFPSLPPTSPAPPCASMSPLPSIVPSYLRCLNMNPGPNLMRAFEFSYPAVWSVGV